MEEQLRLNREIEARRQKEREEDLRREQSRLREDDARRSRERTEEEARRRREREEEEEDDYDDDDDDDYDEDEDDDDEDDDDEDDDYDEDEDDDDDEDDEPERRRLLIEELSEVASRRLEKNKSRTLKLGQPGLFDTATVEAASEDANPASDESNSSHNKYENGIDFCCEEYSSERGENISPSQDKSWDLINGVVVLKTNIPDLDAALVDRPDKFGKQ